MTDSEEVGPPTGGAYLGPIAEAYTYSGGQFRFEPPGAEVPGVDWQSADSESCLGGEPRPGTTRTIELARVSDPNSGTMRADGSIEPFMDRTLAYVVTTTGVSMRRKGGKQTAGPRRPPMPPQSGTVVEIVSAHTGYPIYGFSGPGLKRVPLT